MNDIPGGNKGLGFNQVSFLADDDIRLSLLSLAYRMRVERNWTLKQVEEELKGLEDIYFGEDDDKT